MTALQRVIAPWKDYALLDSGDGRKLERFGEVILARPEPQALWRPADAAAWHGVMASYDRDVEKGEWTYHGKVPREWEISWENLRFRIALTSFKHTGLFPEQASNWQWLREVVRPGMQVLNLFGYTGAASLAAASMGASVVHVDASKPVVTWGNGNAQLSGLGDKPIRWIEDDAGKFVAREVRRGRFYDVILMDPPAFGHGPGGEMWKFAEGLPLLLRECARLLKPTGGALLVNAYSLGYPALVVENLVRDTVPFVQRVESVELTLQESGKRGLLLPAGVAVRARW